MDKNKHYHDTCYEVWRSGGNPDHVSRERTDDGFYAGMSYEEQARREMQRLYPPQEEPEEGQEDQTP